MWLYNFQRDDMIVMSNGLLEAVIDPYGRVVSLCKQGSSRWVKGLSHLVVCLKFKNMEMVQWSH